MWCRVCTMPAITMSVVTWTSSIPQRLVNAHAPLLPVLPTDVWRQRGCALQQGLPGHAEMSCV